MELQRRQVQLKEWEPREVELEGQELAELQQIPARLTIQPLARPKLYLVTPKSVIGSATTRNLQVLIEPKLEIERVFFLLGYARKVPLLRESVELGEREEIVEAFVLAFLDVLQRVLRRGLLMGYVTREEGLPVVRGRIRFADQTRRRFGLPLPVEVRYDDYTIDINENRLLKAALRRLTRFHLRRPALRARVVELLAAFEGVSDVAYDARVLPSFSFNRLTARYRQPLELARLILENASVELNPGRAPMSAILFDMDDVFEDFAFASIGDELRVRVPAAWRWRQGKALPLDEAGRIRPEPDLSLWRRTRCLFVGDAKYKRTAHGEVDDFYQLLAYCSASGLSEGLLLYGESTAPTSHRIVRGGPTLHVASVNVEAPIDQLLAHSSHLAVRIAHMAGAAAASVTKGAAA